MKDLTTEFHLTNLHDKKLNAHYLPQFHTVPIFLELNSINYQLPAVSFSLIQFCITLIYTYYNLNINLFCKNTAAMVRYFVDY